MPLVLLVSFGLAAALFDVAGDHSYSASMVRKATVATVAFLIAAAPPLTALTLGLFRYQKALKDVRYAAV